MATRAYTSTAYGSLSERITWSGLLNTDDGAPYSGLLDAIRTVQVTGTFSTATVTIQGSLEATPTNYLTLNDLQGNPLTFTTGAGNRIEGLQEGIVSIRPIVSGGDGTTNLVCILMQARRSGGVI
jgi:hypothetical protein